MKTKSVEPVASPVAPSGSGFTIGLDLGDQRHWVGVLDAVGTPVREDSLLNERASLRKLLQTYPQALVALEAGTHSPWISRYLRELGATVLWPIPESSTPSPDIERKCDRRDAPRLARLARADPALLSPIQHGSAQAQQDLLGMKLRDALVRTRVNLINAVRFTLKSLGYTVRNPSSASFHKSVLEEAPAECHAVMQPLVAVLAQISEQIKTLEASLMARARSAYPAGRWLEPMAGVGPLTALCFGLRIEDPGRFGRSREVGRTWGCVRDATRAGAWISNCGSANAGTVTCAGCWSARRITFWDPSGRRVPCGNTANG